MPRGFYDHYKIRNTPLRHLTDCSCCVCKAKRLEPHKPTCHCVSCRNKKGDHPKHKEECVCSVCKVKRGEFAHAKTCKCVSCLSKRGEWVHKPGCSCGSCRQKNAGNWGLKYKPRSDKGVCRPEISGANSWNWKGGIARTNQKIRVSWEYKLWRRSVFKRDNYACILCGDRSVIQADHIKPFALYPDLRFDVNNGRTLCLPCHRKTDTWGGRSKKNGAM